MEVSFSKSAVVCLVLYSFAFDVWCSLVHVIGVCLAPSRTM